MKKLSDLMILASFLSSLFYAVSYPYIYAESLKAVTKYFISFEQIVSCLAITCFCVVWNKYSDRLFKHYRLMLWAEIIADGFLMIYAAVTQDMKFYFVLNVLIYAVVTQNIICGGTKMRAIVNPTEKARERYGAFERRGVEREITAVGDQNDKAEHQQPIAGFVHVESPFEQLENRVGAAAEQQAPEAVLPDHRVDQRKDEHELQDDRRIVAARTDAADQIQTQQLKRAEASAQYQQISEHFGQEEGRKGHEKAQQLCQQPPCRILLG